MENFNRLSKYIDRRFDERDRLKRREKEEKVEEIKDREKCNFLCRKCGLEYSCIARKRTGLKNSQWWVGKCVCGTNNIYKYRGDNKYIYRSKFLRMQRVKHYYDIIDNRHEMFEIFYGKQK